MSILVKAFLFLKNLNSFYYNILIWFFNFRQIFFYPYASLSTLTGYSLGQLLICPSESLFTIFLHCCLWIMCLYCLYFSWFLNFFIIFINGAKHHLNPVKFTRWCGLVVYFWSSYVSKYFFKFFHHVLIIQLSTKFYYN